MNTHTRLSDESTENKIEKTVRSCYPIRLCRKWFKPKPVVGLIRLSGIISAPSGSGFGRQPLSLEGLNVNLNKIFKLKNLKAVALIINSPGGSPVQSELIFRRIRQLSSEKEVPVIAFVEDVAASGGYWLACAGDEIIALDTSIVGSIGVIYAGFGFQDFIKKWGIERRVYTQGKRKSILDPFQEVREDDITSIMELSGDMHDSFKSMVCERRQGKIKEEDKDTLFSGLFWTAGRAIGLGLVDSIGDYHTVLRERYGKDIVFKQVTKSKGILSKFLGAGKEEALVGTLLTSAEERIARAQFGL
ncbi:MAG: S49 family peptidase [Alphaproteobacteria bacterium]|nr:S49 family peptidase [Alphaproteobacteria bacterium]